MNGGSLSTLETDTISLPPLGEDGEKCPACAAPLAVDQRYCLNCGARRAEPRLPFREVVQRQGREQAAAVAPTPARQPRDWTPVMALASLGILAIVLVLGILIGRTGSDSDSPGAQVISLEEGGAAAGGGTENVSADLGRARETWPEGKEGWTVELGSLSKDKSADAVQAAREDAESKGAEDVGIIDSDAHASLPGGSWIVYSGVYDDKAGASSALRDLKKEFPDAQVIEVADTKPKGEKVDIGNAETLDTEDLQELDNLSGDEYVKKSRKLPDETAIPGEAPPKDNKTPGGGSDPTVIE